MKYILIGRSLKDTKKFKIMTIQTAKFTVPSAGRTNIPFKKVKSSYYDSKYSSYRSGYKLMGYVLYGERIKDQREVYTYSSSPLFKDAIYAIIELKSGDITDNTFIKKEAEDVIIPGQGIVPGGEGGGRPIRPKPEDVIEVE